MRSLILLAMVVCTCIIWIIYVKKKTSIEHFNVLGGSMDIRYGTIGSTTMTAATLNAWIPVASWTNSAAWQNHALTIEIYPHNRNVGATRQTFAVLVRNSDKAQESDPIFVQQNIFDSLADGTNTGPTFKTAALRYTTDPKNPLNNLYELFFQMGTGYCNNVSCAWVLSDFTTSDTIATSNTDQVASVNGGTKIYAPRMIGGNVQVPNIFPSLQVGDNDKENMIKFKGVTGDGGSDQGNSYNMSVISERLWGGPDQSELLLFKGNDNEACGNGTCGPDRIRLDSTGDVQIQTGNAGRVYDPMNNTGNTVFHARDDGRVSIGMQGQGKAGSKDRPTNMANPYNDRIGAPTTFIDRLEVGSDPQNTKTAAVLRFNQSGSGMGEFYKPAGNVIYLRETPGQNGAAGSNFGNFNVQVPMTTQQITTTGNIMSNNVDINHHPPRPVTFGADPTKVWDSQGGEGATGNGTKIQIWDGYRSSGQLASFIPSTGQIIWANSGRCLDLPNNVTTNGNQLQQFDCNGSPAQNWAFPGGGQITHKQSGKCVDLSNANTTNGTVVQLWDCNKSAAQRWFV